jgi:hypothetical protein
MECNECQLTRLPPRARLARMHPAVPKTNDKTSQPTPDPNLYKTKPFQLALLSAAILFAFCVLCLLCVDVCRRLPPVERPVLLS